MEIHVVAVEARSPLGNYANTQASGLAMWPAAGAPLIVTTCNIKPGSTVTVAFSGVKLGDRQVVEAQLTASTRLRQASEAFLSLASRGWRCSDPGPSLGAGLHLHLLRLAADCQKPYHDGLSSCWSEPQEQWISRDVQLVFAPFGARSAQAANPLSLWTLVARGSRQHFACVVLVLLRSHRSYAILLGSSIVLTQCNLCHDDKLVMLIYVPMFAICTNESLRRAAVNASGDSNRILCLRNWPAIVSEARSAVAGTGGRNVTATGGLVTGTAFLTCASHVPLMMHLRVPC